MQLALKLLMALCVCSITVSLTGGDFSFLFVMAHKQNTVENKTLEILDIALADVISINIFS